MARTQQFKVTFMLNADGILQVSAEELRSGTKQHIEMKPQYGISDEDIKEMLKKSLDNAQEDMDQRSIVEASTEANQLVYATVKFLKENESLVKETDAAVIKQHSKNINKFIRAKDRDSIVNEMELLNLATKKYAEIIMDQSISKALKGKKIN